MIVRGIGTASSIMAERAAGRLPRSADRGAYRQPTCSVVAGAPEGLKIRGNVAAFEDRFDGRFHRRGFFLQI